MSRYRYRRLYGPSQKNLVKQSTVPEIKNLQGLSVSDLKKIKKSFDIYLAKHAQHQQKYAADNEANKKKSAINQKNINEYYRWIEEYKRVIVSENDKKRGEVLLRLQKNKLGFIDGMFSQTIQIYGMKVPAEIGAQIQRDLDEIEREKVTQNKKMEKTYQQWQASIKTLTEIPIFTYQNPTLTINGTRMKLIIDRFKLSEVDNLLKEKVQIEENEKQKKKDEIDTLRARASEKESQVRAQAAKHRNDFRSQYEKVRSCPYCGDGLSQSDCHLDHIYPVSKGGLSTKKNLVFVCSNCNKRKGDKMLRKFIQKENLKESLVHKNLDILKKDF